MSLLLYITLFLYAISIALTLAAHLKKKEGLLTASKWTLIAGIVTHTAALLIRTMEYNHAPMASMYETLLFYSWTITLVSLIVIFRYNERLTELVNVTMAIVALLFAFANEAPGKALSLILNTRWFEIHVTSSFAAYALFTLSFSAAIFYLIFKWRGAGESLLKKYENIAARGIMWGFLFFSASMFAGAIWGYLAWGTYWMWEPKIIWSFIVWFYYAGAMHACFVRRWRGTGLAVATALGIFVVLFTYLGVGMLMKSSHSF